MIKTHLPGLLEHGFDDFKEVLAGLECFEDVLKTPFDISTAD
ncbi:hypothetical protein [uncultured Roseobacter sp.]|nr:hypothetical protein [uncultured Roseobacter sp.]